MWHLYCLGLEHLIFDTLISLMLKATTFSAVNITNFAGQVVSLALKLLNSPIWQEKKPPHHANLKASCRKALEISRTETQAWLKTNLKNNPRSFIILSPQTWAGNTLLHFPGTESCSCLTREGEVLPTWSLAGWVDSQSGSHLAGLRISGQAGTATSLLSTAFLKHSTRTEMFFLTAVSVTHLHFQGYQCQGEKWVISKYY